MRTTRQGDPRRYGFSHLDLAVVGGGNFLILSKSFYKSRRERRFTKQHLVVVS